MNDFPPYLAGMPGFIAGLAIGPLLGRWVALLLTALGKVPRPATVAARPTHITWAFVVLHPVPWLLVAGLAWGAWRLGSGPVAPGWAWFWGTAVATPVLLYSMAAWTLLRARARRARQD